MSLSSLQLLQKTKKIEQQQKHVAGDGLIIENTIWFSASRRRFESGRTSHQNYSEESRFPSEIHSYKSPVPQFDFKTCSAHVYSTKSNVTNKSMYETLVMYIGISETCLKIISPLLDFFFILQYILILKYCPALIFKMFLTAKTKSPGQCCPPCGTTD